MVVDLVEQYKSVVDFFGSQTAAANALGVEQPSVWAWLNGKSKMSAEVAFLAEKLTDGKFRASDLRPSLSSLPTA